MLFDMRDIRAYEAYIRHILDISGGDINLK